MTNDQTDLFMTVLEDSVKKRWFAMFMCLTELVNQWDINNNFNEDTLKQAKYLVESIGSEAVGYENNYVGK